MPGPQVAEPGVQAMINTVQVRGGVSGGVGDPVCHLSCACLILLPRWTKDCQYQGSPPAIAPLCASCLTLVTRHPSWQGISWTATAAGDDRDGLQLTPPEVRPRASPCCAHKFASARFLPRPCAPQCAHSWSGLEWSSADTLLLDQGNPGQPHPASFIWLSGRSSCSSALPSLVAHLPALCPPTLQEVLQGILEVMRGGAA